MTSRKLSSQRGNTAPLILGILLLVALGVGGWFYMTKNNPNLQSPADMAADGQTTTPDETSATANDMNEPLPGSNQPPSDIAPVQPDAGVAPADTATGPQASAGPAAIDVSQATSVRAIGDVNAPVKLIEYASLTCSHCAHFHNDILPELKSKYIDTGKVYLEFREFPLNDPALKATLTARCLPQDKYEGFVALLFKTQDQWAGGIDYMAALRQNAKLAGMSDATFDACQAEPALKTAIAQSMQEAQDKWKINSTPTFIVNDGAETISGAVPLAEFERVFRKVSGDTVGEAPAVQ